MTDATTHRGVFRPRRLAHVNFWVDDPETAYPFWRDVVGLEAVYRRVDIKGLFLSNGNTYHDSALFGLDTPQGKGKRPGGLHHIAFELETEAELVEDFPKVADYGYAFDFTLSADVAHCCYGHDPEGNRFEVYADVKTGWRELRKGDIERGGRNPPWQPGASPPVAEKCYPVEPEIRVIEDAVFHPKRMAHACLIAKDYGVLYRHYTDFVGLAPIAGGPDAPFAVLAGSTGEESLAIFREAPDRPPGFHHAGLELIDAVALEDAFRKLDARGLRIERVVEHPIRSCVYVKDPTGNLLQFFVNGRAPIAGLADLPEDEALFLA